MTKEQLLKLALQEATSRIADYTPADLNSLIKTLLASTKAEEGPALEPLKLKGFLEENLIK